MLDLASAIKHCEEKAKELKEEAHSYSDDERYSGAEADCLECAKEHEQLAAWLTELQERREADKWIPVSERLPEDYTKVLITNEYGTIICVNWNTWYQNEYKDAKKEYKAIAWKPLPKPYEPKEESEAEELYNQAAVEYTEYCERYEPTYNPNDGSM